MHLRFHTKFAYKEYANIRYLCYIDTTGIYINICINTSLVQSSDCYSIRKRITRSLKRYLRTVYALSYDFSPPDKYLHNYPRVQIIDYNKEQNGGCCVGFRVPHYCADTFVVSGLRVGRNIVFKYNVGWSKIDIPPRSAFNTPNPQ